MIDVPAETPWLWVGLTLASAVMVGAVLGLPTPAPDADRVARTIDDVATAGPGAAASVELRATSVLIGSDHVGLDGPGGRDRAALEYGPVTPVPPDSTLQSVLDGRAPGAVFRSPAGFERTLLTARRTGQGWQAAGEQLRVRHVAYGEVNSVLVGA